MLGTGLGSRHSSFLEASRHASFASEGLGEAQCNKTKLVNEVTCCPDAGALTLLHTAAVVA